MYIRLWNAADRLNKQMKGAEKACELKDEDVVKMLHGLRRTLIEHNIVLKKNQATLLFDVVQFYLTEKSSQKAFKAFINCACVADFYNKARNHLIKLDGAQGLKDSDEGRTLDGHGERW